jgi:hypothetical protein
MLRLCGNKAADEIKNMEIGRFVVFIEFAIVRRVIFDPVFFADAVTRMPVNKKTMDAGIGDGYPESSQEQG